MSELINKSILNLQKPHAKQQEFLASDKKRIVLNWARRCFVAGTPVRLADNTLIPIESIVPGMQVASYNQRTKQVEAKEVHDVYSFGLDSQPKPLLELEIHGTNITSTYDHEYYSGGYWIPAYKLAWGKMATSDRHRLAVLCEQYGEIVDDWLQGEFKNLGYETSARRERLLADNDKAKRQAKNRKNTPTSSYHLDSEYIEQTTSESYRQRQGEQPSIELRVGDAPREHWSLYEAESAIKKLGREIRLAHSQGGGRIENTTDTSSKSDGFKAGTVKEVGSGLSDGKFRNYTERTQAKNLEVSFVAVRESQTTYDLEVKENHNYFVNKVLVHNSGKSFGAGEKIAMSAIMDQGNYYIIAPTGGNAKKIYWDDILKVIFKDSPLVDKQFVKSIGRKDWNEVGFNENEMSITIDYIQNSKVTMPDGTVRTINHDTKKPRSKIVLYGATEPDNILGIGLKGVVMDECAKMQNFKYVWQKVLRPMLGDHKGWAVFISTPLGIHNPWYEWVNTAKARPDQYFFSHATGYDNPHFPDSEIEEARQDAIAANELNVFEQEWLAEFVNPEGAIFPEFDPEIHTFQPNELPKEGTKILGVDFGFNPDPASILCSLIDENGDWWVYDETYDNGLDDDRIANVIKNKQMDNVFTRIIGDGQRKDSIALLRRVYRIPMIPGPKGAGSIKTGISQIHTLLRVGANGKPRLRIAAHLLNTIREFQSYSRKRDAQGVYYDIPEDKNNHCIDNLRYQIAIMQRADDEKKDEYKPKAKKQYDPTTGRPLN